MTRFPTRRSLLRTAGLTVAGGVAGCQRLTGLFPESRRTDARQSTAGPITGTVADTDGNPVADASVAALDETGAEIAIESTDDSGGFRLDATRPVWLRARGPGFIERVVAGQPGTSVSMTLVSSAGTAALTFGGDVMFGRRFYEESSDSLAPHHHIQQGQRQAGHDAVLQPISPVLSSADITSVNLESPLTTSSLRHPTKTYTFTSHPVAAQSLADAGVDYLALGNNHVFDALATGLTDTTAELDAAALNYSGAGTDTESAWEPAMTEVSGIDIAMLSCSDIVGESYDLHWSADQAEGRPTTVTIDEEPLIIPAGVGTAEATADRIRSRVQAATDVADIVVIQIHGGSQDSRQPTERMVTLTEAAVDAGADLVVNHHPHVIGGIEQRNGTVIAWSLGNLIFDQTLWKTFPSYLLTAYVTADGVIRTVINPLLLEGYIPYGVVGKPARYIQNLTGSLSSDSVRRTDTGIAHGEGATLPTTTTTTFEEAGIYEQHTGWVTGVNNGTIRLGRDRLPTGRFESNDIDATGHDGTLWRFSRNPRASGPNFGSGGSGGVRLRRIAGNSANVILSNRRRIPINRELTFIADYLTDAQAGFTLDITWYPDTDSSAVDRNSWTLSSTGGVWDRISQSVTPPDEATHMNLLFVLTPPNTGRRTAYIDQVRLIEWADEETTAGRAFDHFEISDTATVEFSVPASETGDDWRRLNQL